VAIFEVLQLDEDFHAILHTGSAEKMKELARAKKMPLLFDDGIRRALMGATTLEEVFRVAFSS
jgi:type II secretory ATPase GspE/PulE/Tfp pilus assembly ATPase PilB-like protein